MTAEQKEEFMSDLGKTMNQRSKYKNMGKKIRKFGMLVLGGLTLGAVAAAAQQYLFHAVAWYVFPVELVVLCLALACIGGYVLIQHLDMKSCLSFHAKLDAIEPVPSNVVGRPSFSRPVVEDRYRSPKEMELAAAAAAKEDEEVTVVVGV